MAEIPSSYTSGVGRRRGANQFYMKENAEFKFFDTDYTGAFLRNFIRSRATMNSWDIASMGTASGTQGLLTPAYGIVKFMAIQAAESAYMSLASAEAGNDLIFLTNDCVSNGEVTIGMTGINTASLFNLSGVRCSALKFSISATNGSCFVHLRCLSDGKWSVIQLSGPDTEAIAMPEA